MQPRRLLLAAALMAAACDDATAPAPTHPLVGTWDLEITLQAFAFEISPSQSPSECSPAQLTCAVARPPSGAYFRGSLTVGDSIARADASTFLLHAVSASLVQRTCAVPSVDASGCGALGAETTVTYDEPSALNLPRTPTDSLALLAFQGSMVVRGTTGPVVGFYVEMASRDALTGRFGWSASTTGRFPAQYSGRFVARRRP
jgi:hypothetical protein